jgi:fatty-acyl-CoA synthase
MYPGTYAKTQPDKIAVHRPSTGESITFADLDVRSNRLAQLLYARGLRRGDHVAIFAENHLVFFDAIWACLRSGLYLTTINRYLTAAEAAYIVDNSDAAALIASAALGESDELGRLTPRTTVKLALGGDIEGFESYEAAAAAQPATPLAEEHIGGFMLYSSGTTGKPKGILRPLPVGHPSQGNPLLSVNVFGLNRETVYLSPAPMYHSAPTMSTSTCLQAGGTVVMMDKFDAALSLELIEKYEVTHSQWVPTMFIRMLKLPHDERTRWDLGTHKVAFHAAAPCPVEVKRRMIDWWGPIITEYYAATEVTGVSVIDSQDWLEHAGSVGRPMGPPFHICDDDGAELPPCEPGLIYGESLTGGPPPSYYKDEGKSASALHPRHSNWSTVGDIGYLDEQGYLFLTDRKAFMIISGGVNIYPQQIEDALALHPKIADVAVIGVPNADLGEEVKAVVEPAPGVEPSEELAQEITDFVRAKLGRQLTPRSVDFTKELPRLPTGKLYKKVLRDQYWGEGAEKIPFASRN